MITMTTKHMMELIESDNGFTLWVTEDFNPTLGYVVGRSDLSPSVVLDPTHRAAMRVALVEVQRRAELAQAISNEHGIDVEFALGAWFDGEKVWLDLSQYVDTKKEAQALAASLGEISFWDIGNSAEIKTV